MRQDRRLNGWVMAGSIAQIISSIIIFIAGGFIAVGGFLYTEQLTKFKDIAFFVNQKGIDKACRAIFDGQTLKIEYLYLSIGIIFAVVGLISLITSVVSLNHAKKRRVVRHRFGLFMCAVIPMIIVGCATTYLVLEFKSLTDNIKYVVYGIIGTFGFAALCILLGIIFSRSEKFMSNDNNKFGFGSASMKEARADVNNNIRTTQVQNSINRVQPQTNQNLAQPSQQRPMQPGTQPQQQRPVQRPQMQRTMQSGQNMNLRPQMPTRPVRPMQPGTQPQQRPMQAQRPTGVARPTMPQRPAGISQTRPVQQRPNVCKKCGRMLTPQEKICSRCGYKVTE